MKNLSFKEKLQKVYDISVSLSYDEAEDVIDTTAKYGEDTSNIIWSYVDGIMQAHYEKMMNGECSVQANIDFDIEKEEKKVDKHIKLLLDILNIEREKAPTSIYMRQLTGNQLDLLKNPKNGKLKIGKGFNSGFIFFTSQKYKVIRIDHGYNIIKI